MDMLVSTERLAEELAAPDLAVLDASLHLPMAERDARAEFETAHIPGARFLDLAGLHDPASALPGKVPDGERVARWLGERGIGPQTRIVLYDDSDLRSACRAWVLLDLAGLGNIAVLDGGLAKWKAEGRPLESGTPEIAAMDRPATTVRITDLRDKAAMLANLDDHREQVVDARDAGRFTGSVEDAVHGLPGGHIPGARHLFFRDVLAEDGTFRDPETLRALFDKAGLDLDRPIVATCGSGVTASVLLFALRLLGAPQTALYDGSWSEWGADPDTPKETGEAR
ncbi:MULTISPECIES: sulfurtransferase [Citromicrobium]|uniref:sulfurtransferase n=1 Tax=Citromicrobium TaxID=72173 RepID=UPI0002FB1695|nr:MULTISPECIES: sulfurtransferase [Citromicrobium]ALG60729.1 3-mercaptopyruvate sulfurtransferase [Citromicrobium sp. JL477]KPM14669.1 3-mercaptopyruvate sulfurtransferase [Citromicrobium sp. JL1351]KPM19969.1 3-mercaptopyruvate sulfurtransferase [Citromicrobium sp. JL31]KPM22925.1 3-mercaptopyruvate sulfurtransferase [Citromicrobium sp. JL2201]